MRSGNVDHLGAGVNLQPVGGRTTPATKDTMETGPTPQPPDIFTRAPIQSAPTQTVTIVYSGIDDTKRIPPPISPT